MRAKKINTPETVIEPAAVQPVMVEPAPAATADPVQEAMDARDALMRRHEAVMDEAAAVKADLDQIEAAAGELLVADQLDQSAYEANRIRFAEVVKHLDMLRARADVLWQRGVEAEQARTIAIAKRNEIQREAELLEYYREVEANEQRFLGALRALFKRLDGRVGGSWDWVAGGTEYADYILRVGELTAWAQSLGVSEPYRFGLNTATFLLQRGMQHKGDPREV